MGDHGISDAYLKAALQQQAYQQQYVSAFSATSPYATSASPTSQWITGVIGPYATTEAPRAKTNLAWLDGRVNEVRVRL